MYLHMALFENGHISVGIWVKELGRCTIGSEPFVQQNAIKLVNWVVVIWKPLTVHYNNWKVISFASTMQSACSIHSACTPTGQNTSSPERGLGVKSKTNGRIRK